MSQRGSRAAGAALAVFATLVPLGCGDSSSGTDDGAGTDGDDAAEVPVDVLDRDDTVETPVDVPPADDAGGADDALPPPSPAFQVATNHQWTCDEEYTWAINVDTTVLDETGAPLPDVRVLVEHDDCETAAEHPPPAEVVTGADGTVRWENYNPRCFFRERLADAPSDTAVELYTGIWEDQDDGAGGRCNYCSTYAENVWGHWSYSLVFRRNPAATELCEVPTDHAGQAHCSPTLHWLEPAPCTPL